MHSPHLRAARLVTDKVRRRRTVVLSTVSALALTAVLPSSALAFLLPFLLTGDRHG